jgi:hypothetical protein
MKTSELMLNILGKLRERVLVESGGCARSVVG